MTFAQTIAKSQELDRALARHIEDGTMAEIGGKRLVGELGGILGQVRKAAEEARLGIAGAASELMSEVGNLKQVEKAIRSETATVREFSASLLGNAVGGENLTDSETGENIEAQPPAPDGEKG